MRTAVVLFAAITLSGVAGGAVTPEQASEGWVALFDGETLFGWTAQGPGTWRVVDGAIVPDSGEYGWLRHNAAFGNFELHCEFRSAPTSNSGLFLRSAAFGMPHLSGYELQIFDDHKQYPTGSLVGHAAASGGRITGEWQSFDVRVVGQRIQVSLDGKVVVNVRDGKSPAGHIGLQFNPGSKVQFRSIRVRPLGLVPLAPVSGLAGWRKVEPPKPAKSPAEWSVRDGVIHVEKGPGQLETESTFRDFVLQMDVRTNPRDENHHPNSGVFLRGAPGVWWSGYESQIRNEFAEGDPTKAVDFGTGGIYRSQPARRIVAKDGQYFTKTIVANGRDFNVWVNGVQVTSWRDDRTEGSNVRNQQAVLTPGTISLQAHDPTTNLDFRNIGIAELPAFRE